MIEYHLEALGPEAPPEDVVLLGKVRARRSGKSGYRMLCSLWDAGFGADAPDGICVPEPLGTISKFRMWLQRKEPGRTATELLAQPGGVVLVRRISEAAHKLHRADVPTERRHTMADELRILHERLPEVGRREPLGQRRIERLLAACDRLGGSRRRSLVACGVHRDFYADQVLVDGQRLVLLDFDLYCVGDPALDIGNFLGHMTEQSLRTLGDPSALAHRGAGDGGAVRGAFGRRRVRRPPTAALTLARHVHLSTLFPERRHLTGDLLELCEERVRC